MYFKCGVLLFAALCDTVNVVFFFIFSGILEEQVDGPEEPHYVHISVRNVMFLQQCRGGDQDTTPLCP